MKTSSERSFMKPSGEIVDTYIRSALMGGQKENGRFVTTLLALEKSSYDDKL
jgi:hypothetical protein